MNMTRRRAVLFVALLLSLSILLALLPGSARIVKDPEDLRAFYCGGQTVLAHKDPYLAEPIRSCEARETRAAGLNPFPGLALPAPLPAFALLPFAGLGLLGFATASSLYVLLLILAMAVTGILTTRMSGFPAIGTLAALLLSDGLVTVLNGQIFPFALLALCACAFELHRGRYRVASVYAALAAIEPHVALPALASLAWSLPRTRLPIALSLVALAAIALVTIGIGPNLEYLLRVLPAHARSESASGLGQYSLTALLFHMGVPRDYAIVIGNVQYAAMCVIGIIVARRLAATYSAPEVYALVPPAFAVFGGPFIHLTQMAVTIPALFALAHRIPKYRNAFGLALLLMAIPWEDLVENGTAISLASIVVVAGSVSFVFWRNDRGIAFVATAGALIIGVAERLLRLAYPPSHVNPGAAIAAVSAPDDLAESTWEAFITTTQAGNAWHFFFAHLPTWLGVSILIAAACMANRGTPTLHRTARNVEPSGSEARTDRRRTSNA